MRNSSDGSPLYGWTFHQSHDQATVLFLVPQATSASDLDIRIANDHVVASVLNHPPILQAKLYGRVNTETSTWRIADRDRARKRRSRSFARSFPAVASNSASGSAEAPVARHRKGGLHTGQSTVPSDSNSPGSRTSSSCAQIESPPASQSSLSASIVSIRSGSSYEVLSHSTPSSLPLSSLGPATEWSSGSSDFGSSDSADASLNQSVILSDPGDLRRYGLDSLPPAEQTDNASLRRSQSISNLATSSSSESAASANVVAPSRASPQAGPPEVRLVTIHLDKLDTGIWPLLVVGPAPFQSQSLSSRLTRLLGSELPRDGLVTETFIRDRILNRRSNRREQQQRSAAQLQLNQALEEALSAFEGGERVLAAIRGVSSPESNHEDGSRTSMDSDEDFGPNTSTLSINTIGSDESATVLGSRVVSLSGTSTGLQHPPTTATNAGQLDAELEEENEMLEAWKELEVLARFNMDPTTLSLIGLQFANEYSTHQASSLATQLIQTSSMGIPDAFEYFSRAWRAADVSLATERLVQDFLPLLPSTSSGVAQHDQSALHARIVDALEPSMVNSAVALPATSDVIAEHLYERLQSHSYMSHRQRLVASLGGPKALARLYVSYARLHLPSHASSRSPLAFPYGQLTSPFISGVHSGLLQSSNTRRMPVRNSASLTTSRTPSLASLTFGGIEAGAASPSTRAPNSPTIAESSRVSSPDHAATNAAASRVDFTDFLVHPDRQRASQPPAYYFFREACLLDSEVTVHISSEEWLEALTLAMESEERRKAELDALAQAEEMGSMAGDSESGCLAFSSDSETQRRREQRRSKLRGQQSTAASVGFFNLAWLKKSGATEAGRTRSGKDPPRLEKRNCRKDRRPRAGREREEAGVINFVSGAALLGVALAGSVAALGWWRRTSAALNSSA